MLLVRPVLAASAGLLLLSLAACGGGNDSKATDAARSAPQTGQGYSGGGQGTGRFPGANGLVADISGKTLQVQSQSGQTAVTYTASTTFTAQVTAKLGDVTPASCVMVTPVQDDGTSSGSASGRPATEITAGSVRITPAQNGSCDGGFGNRGGRPSGAPSGMPSGRPSGAPSGGPGDRRGGFGAFGKVTSVSANGFVVTSQLPSRSNGSSSPTTVNVTVSADTTFTTTKQATAKALAVGKCVSANGQADDTGAVTAQRIAISDAANGQCTGGFGGRFGGRFGGGFGGQQGGTA